MGQDEEKQSEQRQITKRVPSNSVITLVVVVIITCVLIASGLFVFYTPIYPSSLHHQNDLFVKFYNNETDSALVFWQIEYIYADGTILQVAGMSNVSSYNSTYGALCFNVTDTANETVHIEAWVAWYNATDEVLLYPGNQTVDMKADLKDYSEIHESQLIVGSNAQEDMLRTRWVQLPFVLDKE